MGSKGVASFNEPERTPPVKKGLPTAFVRGYREMLDEAFSAVEPYSGKTLGKSIGAYAFFDYDDEPIYVGQTTENFATRIGRHLRGQRSDTIAYRILDPFEVAKVSMWPYEQVADRPKRELAELVNQLEYSVYVDAIRNSKYSAILNEKIPPISEEVELPPNFSFDLVPEGMREDREHPDVRIARRAENLSRLSAVAHERGEVSPGLRRVIVIQAVRLADLAAARLSYVEGRRGPSPDAINVSELVGNVIKGFGES